MCLAKGHNTVTPVGIEPRTSRFGVRRSTTMPPRSLIYYQANSLNESWFLMLLIYDNIRLDPNEVIS